MRSRSADGRGLTAAARTPGGAPDTAGDRGTVTAEFAIVLPALLLVTAAVVGTVGVAVDAIRLADAAGVAARAAGRGDEALAGAVVGRLAPGARVEISRGDLVCVHLSRRVAAGPLPGGVTLSAESCAPGDGR